MLVKPKYLVLLYYKYTYIENMEKFREEQMDFCKKKNLLGRIFVASEGINGTLSGLQKDIYCYITNLKKNKRFRDIDFKLEISDKHVFPRLSVKIKKEIVSSKLKKEISLNNIKNNYLNPKKFYQLLQEKEVIVLDARNYYEYELGHFKRAINPNILNFRDLFVWLENNLSLFRNKKVLTYCTGGVRCEKVSVFLQNKGFTEIYQLKGGIISYSQDKEIQGQLFDGKMYVFDQRIGVEVNQKEKVVVGKDYFDQSPCERYINCANPSCNKQILCSEINEHKYFGSCSEECRKNPWNRYFKKKFGK